MYRITPVTYFIDTMVSTGLAGVGVTCATKEILSFDTPNGQNCQSYLKDYVDEVGGYVLNPSGTSQCQFCPVSTTNDILAKLGVYYDVRWRNFTITVAFSIINIIGALFLYWLFRVPKGARRRDS